MLTANVLQRTFQIMHGNKTASAVTVDVGRKQYLVTARHVVDGFAGGSLEIFHDGRWVAISCTLVGLGGGEVDIAVLAPNIQLSPTHPLEPTTANMVLGQFVYFLGFPYGQRQNIAAQVNRNFPLPLVKLGVLSAFADPDANTGKFLVDGHNNPGFSGGPVVFVPHGRAIGGSNQFCLAGIVSAYPSYLEPVVDVHRRELNLYVQNNPGILIAYDIKNACDIIALNPIGISVA